MARQLADSHRRICVGVIGRYIGSDNRCTRDLIGWLAAGSDSTRTGLMRIHVGSLVDDLGWSKPQIRAALARLQDDGLIVWSEEQRTVACVFVLTALTIPTENHRTSYLQQCQLFSDCSAKSYAVKAIQAIEIKRRDGASNAQSNAQYDGASSGASTGADQDSGFRIQGKLPTDVGSSARDAHATGRTGQTNGNGPRTDDLFSGDSQPAQAPKRQPRGQDGPKTPKPRTLAQQPPTQDETRAIFAQHGAPESEADKCLDYWRSAGFARKNGPIRDWPATCRTWIGNWIDRGSTGSRPAYGAKPSRALGPEYLAEAEKRHAEWLRKEESRRQQAIAEGKDPDDVDY